MIKNKESSPIIPVNISEKDVKTNEDHLFWKTHHLENQIDLIYYLLQLYVDESIIPASIFEVLHQLTLIYILSHFLGYQRILILTIDSLGFSSLL